MGKPLRNVQGIALLGRQGEAVGTAVGVGCGAQVDHRAQTHGAKAFHIVGGEFVQCIAAEQPSPAGEAAVTALVAAEVTEVERSIQGDEA